MDSFASIINSEISSRKRELDQVKDSAVKAGKSTFVRRADIERRREEEYLKEQEELEGKHREKRRKQEKEVADNDKQESTEGIVTSLKTNSTDTTKEDEEKVSELSNASNEDVTRRLRAKGEPIRLFGETEKQRRIRLRALEVMEERSEGQRNDFMRELERVDEMIERRAHATDESSGTGSKRKQQADLFAQANETEISLELLANDPDKVYSVIYIWAKRLLHEWEETLEARSVEVKRSNQGKFQAATQRQSKEYLRPFFKQLKHKNMEPDVLARITEIVQHCMDRNYIMANDAYLRLSIGNSPWPIGVTMVGIHERSAREKIFSSQVAHVLNDETQRKWIQSIKRLMTFAQNKYPPDDLSRAIG